MRKGLYIKFYNIFFRKLILFTLLSICVFFKTSFKRDNNILFRCKIYQPGSIGDFYNVILQKDHQLYVSFSEIEDTLDYKIREEKSIILNENDYNKLESLINRIKKYKGFNKKHTGAGGWEIDILTGRKKYNFNYGEKENTVFSELFQEIKILSPIDINLYWGGTRPNSR